MNPTSTCPIYNTYLYVILNVRKMRVNMCNLHNHSLLLVKSRILVIDLYIHEVKLFIECPTSISDARENIICMYLLIRVFRSDNFLLTFANILQSSQGHCNMHQSVLRS